MFETQLDEICLFPLQNKKNSFTFDDKKADEVKNFGRAAQEAEGQVAVGLHGLVLSDARPAP